MTAPVSTLPGSSDADILATPFMRSLVSLCRAEDTYGVWEKKPDRELLKDFIVSRQERRALPIIGDPDPDTVARVEQFYRAAGLAAERQTGLVAMPMMTMSHEGFGRVVLIVGRLVAYSRSLRDVHRFGFETLAALAEEGTKVVAEALAAIETFPEVARA